MIGLCLANVGERADTAVANLVEVDQAPSSGAIIERALPPEAADDLPHGFRLGVAIRRQLGDRLGPALAGEMEIVEDRRQIRLFMARLADVSEGLLDHDPANEVADPRGH
ncbi:MAG TPA: hypothetical protein VFC47_05225 [Caulobacteraceae bacterium]|nr:hypothetical protein [Caulobacteraceae bacterium]